MNNFSKMTLLAVTSALLVLVQPPNVFSQDEHKSTKQTKQTNSQKKQAKSKTEQPAEQTDESTDREAANSESQDATVDTTASGNSNETRRVNNLANLEALLNIIANGVEILCIAIGGPVLIGGFVTLIARRNCFGVVMIGVGSSMVTFGLAFPGILNWLVASARDAGLFS